MGEAFRGPGGGLPAAARALLVPENIRAGVHIKGGGVDVVGSAIIVPDMRYYIREGTVQAGSTVGPAASGYSWGQQHWTSAGQGWNKIWELGALDVRTYKSVSCACNIVFDGGGWDKYVTFTGYIEIGGVKKYVDARRTNQILAWTTEELGDTEPLFVRVCSAGKFSLPSSAPDYATISASYAITNFVTLR